MAVEAPQRVNTPEYYSIRPPLARFDNAEMLTNNDLLSKLAEKTVKAFDKPILGKKLRVVNRDGEPYSPFDRTRHFTLDVLGRPLAEINRKEVQKSGGQLLDQFGNPVKEVKEKDIFLAEAKQVVALYTNDLFDSNNQLKPESQRTWKNIEELTPRLVETLANHGGYGDLVEKSHALNLLAASLQMVRDPQTKLAFKVGIGGSDSAFTSARFLSYGVPALNMAQEIHDLYTQTEQRVLKNAAIAKALSLEDPEGNLTAERKREVREEINTLVKREGQDSLVVTGRLTQEEVDKLRDEYAILKTPPTVQFISTPEAAIYANFQDNPDAVRERTRDQQSGLQSFVQAYYPDIAGQVVYLSDLPWAAHSPETREVRGFFAEVLKTDPQSSELVASLEKSARTHGGEVGASRTAEYIAMHRSAFEDASGNIPNPDYIDYPSKELKQTAEADINLTSGCRSEVRFNLPRLLMAQMSASDLEDYLTDRAEDFTTARSALAWLREQTRDQDRVDESRPFRARIDIHATHILSAYKPPYYNVPNIDIPISEVGDLEGHIAAIPKIAENVELANGQGMLDPKAKKKAIEALLRDHRALLSVIGST